MTLVRLGALLTGVDDSVRWRMVAEVLEEFGWAPDESRAKVCCLIDVRSRTPSGDRVIGWHTGGVVADI